MPLLNKGLIQEVTNQGDNADWSVMIPRYVQLMVRQMAIREKLILGQSIQGSVLYGWKKEKFLLAHQTDTFPATIPFLYKSGANHLTACLYIDPLPRLVALCHPCLLLCCNYSE